MTKEAVPTLYEWVGGMPALERLFEVFYSRVPNDPILAPIFAKMSPKHVKHVAAFVAEVFGGPEAYSERHGGHANMILRHVGRALTEEQRVRWMRLLLECADELGVPSDPEFRSALVAYLEWGTRLAVMNSQPGADVNGEAPMPKWGWGEVKGPYVATEPPVSSTPKTRDPMSKNALRVAMTVDDLFMWPGLSFPRGHSPQTVARQLIDAFKNNGVKDVYAFSCTRPVEGTKALHEVLDAWCGAGHHVGNHTHYHCALNWCSAESYERDMDRSEALLRPWIERAPTRYFRFAFDMWGDQRAKTDRILLKLAKSGFRPAPISMWFSDTLFMFPHFRALLQNDSRVVDEVETLFVDSWMAQLTTQADAARAAMGRDVTHVALIHGVPLAGATMDRICQRMRADGVEFVSLEEAMSDPFNAIAPPSVERRFRNVTQKWCEITGTPVGDMPPRVLAQLGDILPMPGMDLATAFEKCFDELGAGVGGKPVLADFLE